MGVVKGGESSVELAAGILKVIVLMAVDQVTAVLLHAASR